MKLFAIACATTAVAAGNPKKQAFLQKEQAFPATVPLGMDRDGVKGWYTGADGTNKDPASRLAYSGYSKVKCLNDGMPDDHDWHLEPMAYLRARGELDTHKGHVITGKLDASVPPENGVSVVSYDHVIPKDMREPMTPQVCFAFCRRMEQGYTFFGLRNGRDCYCTPYYKAKAGNEGEMCTAPCDGDSNQMCGGENKSLIFEMHSCKNAEIDKKTADQIGYEASSIAPPADTTGKNSNEKSGYLNK